MASQFRVEKVTGNDPWKGSNGPMVDWFLMVRDLSSDRVGNIIITSIPKNTYAAGDQFWAEVKGEKNGLPKLRRLKQEEIPPGAGAAPRSAQQAELPQATPALPQQHNGAVSYERALAVYQRMARDMDREHGYEHTYATTLFLAWLNGKISDPQDEQAF